ncbi:MAG: CinA family nicotinamide mononucleotide deamidase-related protein [bacterium]
MNIQLLLTGDEIMNGDVVDTNSVFIAKLLKDLGLEINKKTSIPDNLRLLVNEITAITKEADILIMSGGLGPTVDDLTSEAVAEAAGIPRCINEMALKHVLSCCKKWGVPLTEPNKKQALLPDGCRIIPNPIGTAVGFSLKINDCEVFCTPGVPGELSVMVRDHIIPTIAKKMPSTLKTSTTKLQVFGIGESHLQRLINERLPDWPKELSLGFRAAMPIMEVKLTARMKTSEKLRHVWAEKLRSILGYHIFSEDDMTLPECFVKMLNDRQKKITTAESCTGGLIASSITRIPGASNVFEAGYVTYSNTIKTKVLGVSEKTLSKHGAVSAPVVQEMLKGALGLSDADYGVAVSGIAGPSGGSSGKPVGTVWLAWGSKNHSHTKCLLFPFGREYFQIFVAHVGLDLVRRFMLDISEEPFYF